MMIPVLNKRSSGIPKGAVYVGRPTVYGNPFKIGPDGDRDQVIAKFWHYFHDKLEQNQEFKEAVDSLKYAKGLVCWCAPERCHADIIAEYLHDSRGA